MNLYMLSGQQNDVQSADGLKTGTTIKSLFVTDVKLRSIRSATELGAFVTSHLGFAECVKHLKTNGSVAFVQ